MTTGFHLPILDTGISLNLSGSIRTLTPLNSGVEHPVTNGTRMSADLPIFQNPLECRGWNQVGAGHKYDSIVSKRITSMVLGASCKLEFPLPFLRGKTNWLLQNLRCHIFSDLGFLGQLEPNGAKNLTNPNSWINRCYSLSYGIGMALRLGSYGRAELNYCLPLNVGNANESVTKTGLSFGIGIDFL